MSGYADKVGELAKHVRGLTEYRGTCPADCSLAVNPPDAMLYTLIIHLNDVHRWSRERIADWMDTLDADLEVHQDVVAEFGLAELQKVKNDLYAMSDPWAGDPWATWTPLAIGEYNKAFASEYEKAIAKMMMVHKPVVLAHGEMGGWTEIGAPKPELKLKTDSTLTFTMQDVDLKTLQLHTGLKNNLHKYIDTGA